MTTPANFDFPPIYQGTEWTPVIQFFQDDDQTIPLDLTGYEVDMHVRRKPSADMDPNVMVALTTRSEGEGAGRITFVDGDGLPADPDEGAIKLFLTSEETAAIKFQGQAASIPAIMTLWYDIELVAPSGRTIRVMRGKWPLDAEVTRVA